MHFHGKKWSMMQVQDATHLKRSKVSSSQPKENEQAPSQGPKSFNSLSTNSHRGWKKA
jgi:hypothetical protein